MRDQEDNFLFLVKTWFRKLFQVVVLKCHELTVHIAAPLKSAAVGL